MHSGTSHRPGMLPGVLACASIAAAGIAAYANSLSCAFVFDDIITIVQNSNIRSLGAWLGGIDYSRVVRPLFQFSCAINYALGGLDPRGFHIFNIGVHILSGFLLFGIVRLTLSSERLRQEYGSKATAVALAVALVWVVHPLNTQAVTYLCQRCESMMGLFYLLTLYSFIRCMTPGRSRVPWLVLTVAVFILGMLTKEVIITAPLMCLFYDYFFLPGPLKRSLARNKVVYLSLAAAWLAAVAAQLPVIQQYPETLAGETGAYSPPVYLATQAGVIAHYLRLVFLPYGLVLDYAWPPATLSVSLVLSALLVVSLLSLTVRLTWKKHPAGFLGIWFFLILGVTSSFLPLEDAAFEHRMYLSSAAVITLAAAVVLRVLRGRPAAGTAGIVLTVAAVGTLAALTALRNRDYRSELSIWQDTLSKRPGNHRAWACAAMALDKLGRTGEAAAGYREALRLVPKDAATWYNYGNVLYKLGELDKSLESYRKALGLDPGRAEYYLGLGTALKALGKQEEAIAAFSSGLGTDSLDPGLHHCLGVVLSEAGRPAEAVSNFSRALAGDPDNPLTNLQMGIALLKLGRYRAALYYLGRARELLPGSVEAENNLGIALMRLGRLGEALGHFERALELDPGNGAVLRNIERIREMSADR